MSQAKIADKKDHIIDSDLWEDQIFTLRDAYAPREPLQYIVSDLFNLPSLSVVYGAPGTMKSLLMADMMTCVVAGIPWLSHEVIQAPAIWIDLDNGLRRTHERIAALSKARDLTEEAPLSYMSMPNPPPSVVSSVYKEHLKGLIVKHGAKLVCIDNLKLISPSADENSDEMAVVMGNLREIAERTGAAIVIIHHQRKGKQNGRTGDSLRGHSSIEAAIDLALHVNRKGSEEHISVTSTKTRDVEVEPFGAIFKYGHKAGAKELDTAYFVDSESDYRALHQAIERAILKINMEHSELGQEKIIERVRENLQATVRTVRDEYKRLLDSGQILKQKNMSA